MRAKEFIMEGGNVFKTKDGAPDTGRINLADVKPTVSWLESITGLPLLDNMLGTTGRKASSGDLDLAVDANALTKEDLVARLQQWTNAKKLDSREYIRKTGDSVHFKTPIGGQMGSGFVQTDFMFGNTDWQKFSMQGGQDNSPFKGMHRHLLMASIAAALGLRWSYKNGLVSRASGNTISKDPDYIAEILLGQGHGPNEFSSVETIFDAIQGRPDYNEIIAQFKDAITKEGIPMPEPQNRLTTRFPHIKSM